MKVLKFGGTSVANSSSLKHVISIVKEQAQCTVVVSALGGVTDLLLEAMHQAGNSDAQYKSVLATLEERHLEPIKAFIPLNKQSSLISFIKVEINKLETLLDGVAMLQEITPKTIDKISSFGEILSSKIIEAIFMTHRLDVRLLDGRDLIVTSIQNNRQIVDWKTTQKKVKEAYQNAKNKITLIPGFIAQNDKGENTTLGRGGSDFTAAIIANILEAQTLEIWTDVSGMFTAHPKIVAQATPIKKLSYLEAMELSHFGAKVIYPPTLQPLVEKNIPIYIKNTFAAQDVGTLISSNEERQNGEVVKGMSHIAKVSLVSLEGSGMIGIPGFSKRLFEALSLEKINVIMITQASSEHSICIGLRSEDASKAKTIIDQEFAFEISLNKVDPAKVENDMVNIAMVGDNMKNHQGISGKMFSTLGANNVNIRAIAQGASERNISIIIAEKDTQKALNSLHEAFFEANIKELNLFVVGVGNVGSKLMEQIHQQKTYLRDILQLRIRVIAMANSRTMMLSDKGIDLTQWKKELPNGQKTDINAFFNHAKSLNLRNSIFVDNTANEMISKEYKRFLENNIGVVTCNKIACADQFENYALLKKTSRKYSSPFLFETNVGAGLPIIDTLSNLIASGDRIHKIQAVLSGSLNYVFNNFLEEDRFKDIVLKAQEEGYTEPDPKIDLSGVDVARKILILARESGIEIELEDIENTPFLPEDCLKTPDNEAFYTSLDRHNAHFNSLLKNAKKNTARLKYVAQLEGNKASVGLQEIPEGHDFYHLNGSDNIILFFTDRYSEQPLIVKGAGAGADVTASGIFGDIIRIGKR
ncbi:MAG: bifunctional aspartate kinase/homoserine dehydrogenase I [Flavobacteriaceae bacterium]